MSDHTPGPWHVDGRSIRSKADQLDWAPNGVKLAQVFGGPVSDEELRGNARLIAAAPEMYTALRMMEAAAKGSSKDLELFFHNLGKALYLAESALAHADGREWGVEHLYTEVPAKD